MGAYDTRSYDTRSYDTLAHEDWPTTTRLRNPPLATSSRDARWGDGLGIRSCKAVGAGRRGVAVPPASTAHACAGCGVTVQTGLSLRWHACPDGATSRQRDHHAAKNLPWRGQRLRGVPARAGALHREPVGL